MTKCIQYTDFTLSPSCFGKPGLIGWLKLIRLEPGRRWGSILGVLLEQNYMMSLLELVVSVGNAIFDIKNETIMKKHDVVEMHIK